MAIIPLTLKNVNAILTLSKQEVPLSFFRGSYEKVYNNPVKHLQSSIRYCCLDRLCATFIYGNCFSLYGNK